MQLVEMRAGEAGERDHARRRAIAAAAGRPRRAVSAPRGSCSRSRSHLLRPMTSALPSRSARSASVRSCFSNGIVASSSSTTTSAKRTARNASATASFSSFSTTRALRRRPAVSNSFSSRSRQCAVSADGVAGEARLRAGQQPVLAEDAVEQRRLAGVRPPEHRDAQRLRRIDRRAVLFLAEFGLRRFVGVLARRASLRQHRRAAPRRGRRCPRRARRRAGSARRGRVVGLVGAGAPRRALGLVGEQEDRLVGAAQRLREMPVGAGHAGARVDHEQDRVAIGERRLGLRAHAAGQRGRIALLQPGGVDDGEGEIAELRLALAAVAGDAGLIVDQRELAADQPVEQRRLADVRAADDGDFGGHGLLRASATARRRGRAASARCGGRPAAPRRRRSPGRAISPRPG